MLIIVNTIDSINRNLIGLRLLETFNDFKIDNLTVKIEGMASSLTNYVLYNEQGSIVYPTEPVDIDSLEKLISFQNDRLSITRSDLLTKLDFGCVEHDYGILNNPIMENLDQPLNTYEAQLDAYRNDSNTCRVILGIFGKWFIDKMRQDIGADKVKVLNIVRNPSVCFVLNQTQNKQNDLFKEYKHLRKSILNAVNLSRFDDITTVKFEDILSSGSIIFNGVTITLPEQYQNHNNLLTAYEYHHLISKATDQNLDQFNQEYSNYEIDHFVDITAEEKTQQTPPPIGLYGFIKVKDVITSTNQILGLNLAEETLTPLKMNVFTSLGYSPLSFSQISS